MPPQKKTILPDARLSPRFAGIATFCRFPQICHVSGEHQPVDWAVYGIPYDGAVTYRPGARFGPRAVREASQYVKPYHMTHDVHLTETLSIADAGDAPVSPYSCRRTQDVASDYALNLGDPASTKLLSIGGDHSTALANMRATWKRRGGPKGGMAALHFDSHIDTVDEIWGEKHTHGSVFRRAIEEGLIDPKRMLSVGMKGPLNRPDDFDYARDQGVTLVTYDQWRREGPGIINDFVNGLGRDEAYLSFDIDVVDPAFAPGTGTLSVGGFTSAEIFDLLRSLAGANIVGADVVEVLPDRDPTGITSLLASHIVFEILCLDAVWKKRGRAG